MTVKGLDDEDFKNQLEQEFQKYLDNKPKKPKVEVVYDASVKSSHPWDELSEQDYKDFMSGRMNSIRRNIYVATIKCCGIVGELILGNNR